MLSRGILASAAVTAACLANVADAGAATKGTLLLNRVGPVTSELYVANADGTNEHKLLPSPGFDYHAAFSADGKWIVFTSERDGLGQSELYRVKADGTGLQRLTHHIAVDDAAVFSPVDADTIAFVSSRSGANVDVTSNRVSAPPSTTTVSAKNRKISVNWPMIDYFEAPVVDVPDAAAQIRNAKELSFSVLYWLQTEAPRPDGRGRSPFRYQARGSGRHGNAGRPRAFG